MNEIKLLLALVGELECLRYQSNIKATLITKAVLDNNTSLAEKRKSELDGSREVWMSMRKCIIAYCGEANIVNPYTGGFQ